jgi:hypothetical protein
MDPQILEEDEKWSRASLCIYSETLTHDEIGATLGIEATRTHSKGQPRGKVGSKTFVYRDWAWFLSTPMGGHPNLAEHLKWVLDIIEPRLDALRMLLATCKVVLYCAFSSGNGQGGFTLDSVMLQRIARLGVPLVLDLYPPSVDRGDDGKSQNGLTA